MTNPTKVTYRWGYSPDHHFELVRVVTPFQVELRDPQTGEVETLWVEYITMTTDGELCFDLSENF